MRGAGLLRKVSHGAYGSINHSRHEGESLQPERRVLTNITEYDSKCRSELCRNCVRSPRNYRQTPTLTGLHQEASCGGKSLNRLREEMFRYDSVRLAGIAFQACSIDHSDISPFRINALRAVWNSVAQSPPSILLFA